MRALRNGSVAAIVVLVWNSSSVSSAQGLSASPGIERGLLGIGIEPLPVPKSMLLGLPAVQEELKITPKQKQRMKDVAKKNRDAITNAGQDYREALERLGEMADPEERAQLSRQFMTKLQALRGGDEKSQLAELEPKQRTRLDQIQIQAEGPLAFTRPEVLDRLNLDPDQVAAITQLAAEGRVAMEDSAAIPLVAEGEEPPDDPESRREIYKSERFRNTYRQQREATLRVRESTMRAIGKLLTDGQRRRYLQLRGEPFDFAPLQNMVRDSILGKPAKQPDAPKASEKKP